MALVALLGAAQPVEPIQRTDGELVVVLFRESPCHPEAGALVTVRGTPHAVRSDTLGIAAFAGLKPGQYRVRIEPLGHTPVARDVTVPRSERTVLAVDVTAGSRHHR